jgi:hypothetical protein
VVTEIEKLNFKNMIKSLLTALFIVNIITVSKSQNITETEYQYLTKGLKTTFEQGLDIKSGYQIGMDYFTYIGDYSFDFKQLLRNDRTIVGDYVDIKSNVSGRTYQVGIPNDLGYYPKLLTQLSIFDAALTRSFFTALYDYNMNFINKAQTGLKSIDDFFEKNPTIKEKYLKSRPKIEESTDTTYQGRY